jgi:hypothetical protein
MKIDRSRRSKLELILTIFCFVGLVVTGHYLFFSKKSEPIENQVESIGSIKPFGGDIRVKGEQELSWNSVARETSVFRNDKVFTGQDSQAKVKLKNNQKLTVEPNSLIVISDEDKNQRVDFTTGGLIAELKKGAKLLVRFKGKDATITTDESAVLRLHANKAGEFKLVVLKGEAQVIKSNDGPTESVKANETFDIAQDAAQPTVASVSLLTPEAGEEIWSESREVDFSWRTQSSANVRLEISHEPEFDSVVESKLVQSNQASIRLPAKGVYFWRVVDASQLDEKSPVSSFSFLELLPPTIEVLTEIEVEIDQERRSRTPVTLSWRDAIASDSYEIEISKSKNFEVFESRHQSELTELTLSRMVPGEYSWRVTSTSKRRKNLLSNVGILKLREKLQPIANTTSPERVPAQEILRSEIKPETKEEPAIPPNAPASPVAVQQEKPRLLEPTPVLRDQKISPPPKTDIKSEEVKASQFHNLHSAL